MGYYPILDRAPKGRDEDDGFQLWIRRHDEYEPTGDVRVRESHRRSRCLPQAYRPASCRAELDRDGAPPGGLNRQPA